MAWLKKAGLIWIAALSLAAAGKGLAQDLQKNKEAIIQTLTANPKNTDATSTYQAYVSEFKEDSTYITDYLSNISLLWNKIVNFYTAEWVDTKINQIIGKYPHFDMLASDVKEKIIREYFSDFIDNNNQQMLYIIILFSTILTIKVHHDSRRKLSNR
jgi:hypothetical protein